MLLLLSVTVQVLYPSINKRKKGFRIPIKHTNEIIPRLELGSVNGKFFYNIDYYPIIFDPALTKSDDDFINAIENLITVYRVKISNLFYCLR